jgi:Repeat of unknown function (DUF346)
MRKLRMAVVGVVVAGAVLTAPAASAAPVSDALDGSAIAAVSMAANRIDLFTRGRDGALHWKTWSGGRWTGWDDLGGQITSAPTASSWADGRMDVFARSATGTLVHKWWTSTAGWNSGWEDLGGAITSAPAAVSWGSGRIDVFARGTNNGLYQKYYSGGWHAWVGLGGTLASAPAVASQKSGSLNVFVRGTNNALYTRAWTGSWSAFTSLGGSLGSAPTATSWADGRLDVFVRDPAGRLFQRYFSGGKWSAAFTNLGDTLSSAPAATSWGSGRLDVFSQSTTGALQQRYYSTQWYGPNRLGPLDPDELPVAPDSRIVGVQAGPAAGAQVGPIEYTYVNNAGYIVQGHQPDAGSTGSVQWSTVAGGDAYTGEPSMAVQPDGRAQALVHNTNGDIVVRSQSAAGSSSFASVDVGGWMISPPSVAKLPDGRLEAFATDADGTLWTKVQTAVNAAYGQWRSLGRASLADAPALGTTRTGLQLFGLDAAGTLKTAAIDAAGTLSAWTTLGTGFAGRPSVIAYAGYKLRLVARTTDGAIVTAMSDSAGVFPGTWTTVGDMVAAGPAAAVLSLQDTRTYLFVRGTDNLIHWTRETDINSGLWESWRSDNSLVSATDPTVVEFDAGGGRTFGYLFKTADNQPYLFVLSNPAGLSAPFAAKRLPAPPK